MFGGKRNLLLLPLVVTLVSAVPVQIQADGVAIATRNIVTAEYVVDDKTAQSTATGSAPAPAAGQAPVIPAAKGASTTTTTTGPLGAGSNSTTTGTNPSGDKTPFTTNPATLGSGTPGTSTLQTPPTRPAGFGDTIKDGFKATAEKVKAKLTDLMQFLGGIIGGGVTTWSTPVTPSTIATPSASTTSATSAAPATAATPAIGATPATT